jgi:hypothetical protein
MDHQLCFCGLYVYKAADMMAYPMLSQMTKFTLLDYYTVTVVRILTFLLWLCKVFNCASLIQAA